MSTGTRGKSASVTGNKPARPDTRNALREWQESQQSPKQPSWNTARFVLRIASTLIAIPLLVLSVLGAAAPIMFSSFWILGMPLVSLIPELSVAAPSINPADCSQSIAAILFDFAGFIVTCVRKRKSGIRPAVSLGFELVISLGGFAISALLVCFTMDAWSWYLYYTNNGNRRLAAPVPNYVSDGYYWFGMSLATSILALFLSLIHFVLFVRDCVEVDRRRKATKRLLNMVAATDPALYRESTIDHPAPSYSVVELESQPGSSNFDNEPSKGPTSSSGTHGDGFDDRLHVYPLEPKSLS
ncbi:hypothetical protein F4818DRAFT_440641 [Hypoxylon cercidicola]|nr:hypothetical protein F4818DRAFT_440641 [Hypoxylon cercidicola]